MSARKLLLVEDNRLSLKLLDALCQAEGYVTRSAHDGQEAIKILYEEPIDLVITDVLMPNVDGYYLCFKIRHDEHLKNIPIVIYTATYTSLSDEKVAEEMGADIFIRKPASGRVLMTAVADLLQKGSMGRLPPTRTTASFEVMHQYSSELVNKLEQRNIALEEIKQSLEQTVYDRTRELQSANKELSATNEELNATNEELYAINEKLNAATELIKSQAEIIIRQKDEQLNRVLESTEHVIWSRNLNDGGEGFVSRSIQNITGESPESFVAKRNPWENLIYPPDMTRWRAIRDQLQREGIVEDTIRITDSSKKIRWILMKYWIVKDESGVPIREEGVWMDVSAQKEAEHALINERQLLRSLIDNIPDYIYVKDRNFRHILNNKGNVELLQAHSEQETLGKTTVDYFGDTGRQYVADDQQVVQSGIPIVNKEEALDLPSGKKILLTTKVPLRDDTGTIIGLVGISRDVTELRQQQRELRQYEENLDIIFSSTEEEILLLNSKGQAILFNKAFETFMFGVTGRVPAIGDYLWDITTLERSETARELFERSQRGETIHTEATFQTASGKVVHELHFEPVFSDGAVKYVSLISIDVTNRVKSEDALKQSLYLLDKAYEVGKIGYWSYDSKSDCNTWSAQAQSILGLPSGYPGSFESFVALIHPEDRNYVTSFAKISLQTSRSYDVEYRIIRPDNGEIRWVHVTADVVNEREADKDLLVGIVQDITERKTLENVLIEYNDRYEMLSKATNDAVWDWDVKHDFIIWNHGIQTIFGYSDTQMVATTAWWNEKIHPEDHERVVREIGKAFKMQSSNWTSQFRYLCADNTYKDILDRGYIIYVDGEAVRMIGAMQDITEQKEFERNITAIARELSELIENANTPIFGTDRNGYVNEWNKVTTVLTGYSKNEVLGKKLADFITANEREHIDAIITAVQHGTMISNQQVSLVTKDYSRLIILLNASARRNSAQQITGILMVGQNITELVEYRQTLELKVQARTAELNEALSKEKELVEMKSRFVSIASHEFRTPLSTIALVNGFLRRHREKITAEEFNAKLDSIEKQVNHMTYLLDDILTIGKSDAGKIKTYYTPVQVDTFFKQVASEVADATRSHAVEVTISTTAKETITDEKLLRNILTNLLSNAIKFSPHEKSVKLRVTDTSRYLRIEVEDKGIGITAEDRHNLFTAFYRGGNVGSIQGTGLGLSIVKKATELLRGDIQVESAAGHGTIFTVTLPLVP